MFRARGCFSILKRIRPEKALFKGWSGPIIARPDNRGVRAASKSANDASRDSESQQQGKASQTKWREPKFLSPLQMRLCNRSGDDAIVDPMLAQALGQHLDL